MSQLGEGFLLKVKIRERKRARLDTAHQQFRYFHESDDKALVLDFASSNCFQLFMLLLAQLHHPRSIRRHRWWHLDIVDIQKPNLEKEFKVLNVAVWLLRK